jgi:hypothetical protein
MAIHKKDIGNGTSLVKLRNSESTSDGTVINETETWTGAYAELKIKRDAVFRGVKSTSLTPTEAGQGELKITRETTLTGGDRPPSVVTTEVIWQELRLPVTEHPAFSGMEVSVIKGIVAAAEDPDGIAPEEPTELALYNLLSKGTTEYATGVPVVRRTTTNIAGNAGSGNAWYRENPPITVDGDWEFLKTADDRREVGRRFDKVEEWTGAKVWDPTLYPPAV